MPANATSSDCARFGRLISSVYRQWRREVDLAFRHLYLTDATRMPVIALYEHGGPMRQKDLAQALALDTTSLVRVLDQLTGRGLVTSGADPSDRRAKSICLTEEGTAIAAQIFQRSLEIEAAILAGFSAEEVATAKRVLEGISRTLQDSAS